MTPQIKAILAVGTVLAGVGAWLSRKKLARLVAVVPSKPTEASIRHNVVTAAISQIGNKNQQPYWIDVMGTQQPASESWCGAFALWALHQAGLVLDKKWIPGQGFLMTHGNLPQTKSPLPGDIAYYDHYQHHAVVANVYPDKTIDLINGNGENHAVSPGHTKLSAPTAFFSIKPYIDAKLAQTA